MIAAGHKLYHQRLATPSALDGVQVDAWTPACNYLQNSLPTVDMTPWRICRLFQQPIGGFVHEFCNSFCPTIVVVSFDVLF